MPLLARMLTAPLVVDVRRGAVADLGALLADRRIATEGRVAVAVGPGQGDSMVAELDIDAAEIFRVEDGTRRQRASRWASSCGPTPTRRWRASAAARPST